MLEASMAFIPDAFTNFTRSDTISEPLTRVAVSQSFLFRCGDNKLLAIHLSTREKFWESLLSALEASELSVDKRFTKHLDRVENYQALREELARRFIVRSRPDWLQRLADSDVPAAPVNTVAEALDDPQVHALGTVSEIRHPTQGVIRSINCPVLVDGERPLNDMAPPPTLGEHTRDILSEATSGRSPNNR
jgi:formyl-CoA transferase